MSEKNLIVRRKFISKIFNKINDLNQSIELLNNVDRKLIQQNGGDLKKLQAVVEIVKGKTEEFKEIPKQIKEVAEQVKTLQDNLETITDKLIDNNNNLVLPIMENFDINSEIYPDTIEGKQALQAKVKELEQEQKQKQVSAAVGAAVGADSSI